MPHPRTFNPNVNYQIRQEGGRYIVINRDRNRRMKKTFETRREAEAHIRETKNRVSKIINYHNRANASGSSRVNHPPPRRAVPNVGRAANPGRAGRPRRRAAATPVATPQRLPRRSGGGGPSGLTRGNTIQSPSTSAPRRTRASKTESRRLQICSNDGDKRIS